MPSNPAYVYFSTYTTGTLELLDSEPKVVLNAYRGSKKIVDGVTFVDGGYYISLRYYERFPPNSPDIFKLSAHIYKENAEGVISRSVTVTEVAVRRSVRANPSSLSVPPMTVEIEEVEKTRLDEIPRLDAV